MPNIRAKSAENLNSAKLLIENGYYTASVHCLYYSCFQLAKYILKTFGTIDYNTQNSQKGADSHSFICEQLFQLNDKQKGRIVAVDCRSYLQKLKFGRVKADYQEFIITEDEITVLREVANKFDTLCKQKYEIV